MKKPFLLLTLLLASCDPLVEGSISVHNATRDTLRINYGCKHCSAVYTMRTTICVPDSTRLLFKFSHKGNVDGFQLDSELDTIFVSQIRRKSFYYVSSTDTNWNIAKDKNWAGGGKIDCLLEVRKDDLRPPTFR